jgi:hypothetical protein
LATRESNDDSFNLGETYIELDNISSLWGADGLATLRIGRMDIPFGEEYRMRDPIDNPLVSHSLPDIWGIDEGIEVFGQIGPADYAFAIQNGGRPAFQDFDGDKSIAARIGFEPTEWLRVSGSAMRTGNLDSENDFISEVWIGNAVFRAIGPPETTTTFSADMVEFDAAIDWEGGHINSLVGWAWYDDNDSVSDNPLRQCRSRPVIDRKTLRSAPIQPDEFGQWISNPRPRRSQSLLLFRCAD